MKAKYKSLIFKLCSFEAEIPRSKLFFFYKKDTFFGWYCQQIILYVKQSDEKYTILKYKLRTFNISC